MNNQAILWSMLILPWLTLFFMRKEDIKRFMPVGLFGAITSMLYGEVGGTLNWWAIRENIFPLSHINPISLGLYPVLTIWIFKFTYERLWRYISVEVVLNLGFAFIMIPWLISRGIRENILATNLTYFFTTSTQAILHFVYQMWQEDSLVPAVKKLISAYIQPATTKPLINDEDEERNNR